MCIANLTKRSYDFFHPSKAINRSLSEIFSLLIVSRVAQTNIKREKHETLYRIKSNLIYGGRIEILLMQYELKNCFPESNRFRRYSWIWTVYLM